MKLTGVVLAIALVGCGKSAEKKDLSKMSTEEACRTIQKRAVECKETIVAEVSKAMKKAGAKDDEVAQLGAMITMPRSCTDVSKEDIDPMITCYDDDCGKLAQCYVAMATEAARPSRAEPVAQPQVGPGSAVSASSAPGSGTGTASGSAAASTEPAPR